MAVLGERRTIQPRRVIGVSGGALAGAAWLGGRSRELLDIMCRLFEEKGRNLDLFHEGEDGLTPHQTLYSEAVAQTLDAAAQRRVAEGPAFQILIAHPPGGPERLTGTAMALAYEAELHLVNSPHFNWAERLGLTAERVDANAAALAGDLARLVCAAAAIPPVFSPPDWNGRPVVDAGMADQAPMPDPDDGATLVLLTRSYRSLPEVPGRIYVTPSEAVAADKIDFTDPRKLRDTWAQGEADAHAWLDRRAA